MGSLLTLETIESKTSPIKVLSTDFFFSLSFQECTLKFGSWAFDGSELDITIQESETGVKEDIYQNNTEWEMLNVTVTREEVCVRTFGRSLSFINQLYPFFFNFKIIELYCILRTTEIYIKELKLYTEYTIISYITLTGCFTKPSFIDCEYFDSRSTKRSLEFRPLQGN